MQGYNQGSSSMQNYQSSGSYNQGWGQQGQGQQQAWGQQAGQQNWGAQTGQAWGTQGYGQVTMIDVSYANFVSFYILHIPFTLFLLCEPTKVHVFRELSIGTLTKLFKEAN